MTDSRVTWTPSGDADSWLESTAKLRRTGRGAPCLGGAPAGSRLAPQLASALLACLALMAFWVTVDRDDPVMLAVSTISMSLQERQATSFWREALRAKRKSWDTPASMAPTTGPNQYTWRQGGGRVT